MNLINIENLSKNYTDKQLFDNADFYLHDNDKTGIIGINGAGKSTLLRIIAGLEEPDSGRYTVANNTVISYLSQNPDFIKGQTVIEAVLAGMNEKTAAEESRAKSLLLKFGIEDFEQKVEELSGGQRKKAAIVSCLLSPAEVLVLDEPTNHLDIETNELLESELKKFRGAIVMVTHDRYFLDAVCNSIVELDRGRLYTYETSYSGYLKLKSEREQQQISGDKKRHNIMRNELEWIQRGARARSTKQKARIERYEELKNIKDFQAEERVQLSSVASRLGRSIIEVKGLCKSYSERVLIKDFTYVFLKNDRIGFVGGNGSGKTTLMKMICGREKPDAGSIDIGQTVKTGYYSQELEESGIAYMNPKLRVIDYIRETAEYVRTDEGLLSASQMLERFLFPPYLQYALIEKLSGGEKRRLNLLRVLMEAPNVLILDEPTNDLDIATLNILEDFLDSFEGVAIIVSHDRYFLDRTVRRIFSFESDGIIRQYEGGYSDYAARKAQEEESGLYETRPGDAKKNPLKSPAAGNQTNAGTGSTSSADFSKNKPREKKLKFTYKEMQDYKSIESEIENLETELQSIEEKILEFSSDFIKLSELTNKKEDLKSKLDEKMDRWMYLEELAARIEEEAK